LAALGITDSCIRTIEDTYTAQAFITTDADGNQITAFHPGAMSQSHVNHVTDAGKVSVAIVAPDGRDGMVQHAQDCAEAGIPFIFDPGQGLPMFNGEELKHFISLATYVAVNDYEGELLSERTGWSLEEIARHVSALVVTRGEQGAHIFVKGEQIDIPCVAAECIVDPTGCGDAFRAGMLYALSNNLGWATTGRLASLMGAIKIAYQGGQSHAPSLTEIQDRFQQAFGYRFD